jgi:hypothetical protein
LLTTLTKFSTIMIASHVNAVTTSSAVLLPTIRSPKQRCQPSRRRTVADDVVEDDLERQRRDKAEYDPDRDDRERGDDQPLVGCT